MLAPAASQFGQRARRRPVARSERPRREDDRSEPRSRIMGGVGDQGLPLLISNRLIRAATALGRVTSRVHKREQGLTSPEFAVLVALSGERSKLTSSHIVEVTAMDKTKVSRAVAALDQRGWISRERATSDRRFEYLTLTETGSNALAHLMPKIFEAESAVLSSLSEDERLGLETGLKGLDRAISH
ncbi:MarR family winged helix-turn-helix transcriptional regulator [Jiella sonneratiae]|uniref:MarR family transcriptional regulator n=1 Tax=Jiella sonneratiae TaxID=2816856 RepID=A0ABS3J6H7_9HYPH|nr:MarR family transcriptional regulator [Jiella sonneratiae]MBO0905269.1 MarR family transcriptional regulator [Jiella sonneratiae]